MRNKFVASSLLGLLFLGALLLEPSIALADVDSSLLAIQEKLTGTILPILSVIGLVLAGISYAIGNASARQHMLYAIIGCAVGFGASSIVNLIRSLVH